VSEPVLIHRVRAVNTAPDSENKIHSDQVAAQYGFRGGLVPGVTVYGYMAVPLVTVEPEWLERGTMEVRFEEPVYDGDLVIVSVERLEGESFRVTAKREDDTICATATAKIPPASPPIPEELTEHSLPNSADRPAPSLDNLTPGAALGTVSEKLQTAEPRELLQFSNEMLVRNFKLGPWIHVGSQIQNFSVARLGEDASARGRIHEVYQRKGHEFVVIDVMLLAGAGRLIHTVRHTAIYRPRPVAS
jgi:hypothetical protein